MTRPAPPDLGRSWWLREALARPEFAGEPCPPLAGDTDADIVIPALPHRSRSSMAVTEPIPEIIESVGWTGGENVRTLRSSVHYLRTTPDGRIAIGLGGLQPDFAYVDHRCAYHEPFVQRVADDLARIFPKLADYVLPFFGTLAPGNVHHGLGFTGNGPGPSHLGGKICAALASGSDDGFTRLPVVTREPDASHRSRSGRQVCSR